MRKSVSGISDFSSNLKNYLEKETEKSICSFGRILKENIKVGQSFSRSLFFKKGETICTLSSEAVLEQLRCPFGKGGVAEGKDIKGCDWLNRVKVT